MKRNPIVAALIAVGLCGCSTASVPTGTGGSFGFSTLDVFHYGIADTSIPTLAYNLSPNELSDIKSQFSGIFTGGRSLEFGPISARRMAERDDYIVCGLVEVREPDGRRSGMQLFDGVGSRSSDGRITFQPERIVGANAKAIDVYSRCRDAGLMGGSPDAPVRTVERANEVAPVSVAQASAPLPEQGLSGSGDVPANDGVGGTAPRG